MKKKTLQRLVMAVAAANYCSSMASYGAAREEERRAPAGGGQQAAAQHQEEARRSQEEAVRGREEQARAAQQESIRQQRQAKPEPAREERQPRQESFAAPEHQQQSNFNARERQQQESFSAQEHQQQAKFNAQQQELTHPQQFAAMNENKNVLQRQFEPREISGARVPLEKATSMPFLEPNATQAEVSHFNQVQANLRQHLMAMPMNQVPGNFGQLQEQVLGNYANNYQVMLNNQMLRINRENTFFSPVPSYEYPSWWQPSPGWVFSNGFTLGNALNVGLDWLRWGWHPYYGAPPDGFVCASNYIPTPWVYVPAYGLWRMAGSNAWAPGGPPFNYSGPITVEVLEPRHVRVVDPYTRFTTNNTINVPYLYNAFFNPQNDRWLYTNRHGYPVYVNL